MTCLQHMASTQLISLRQLVEPCFCIILLHILLGVSRNNHHYCSTHCRLCATVCVISQSGGGVLRPANTAASYRLLAQASQQHQVKLRADVA